MSDHYRFCCPWPPLTGPKLTAQLDLTDRLKELSKKYQDALDRYAKKSADIREAKEKFNGLVDCPNGTPRERLNEAISKGRLRPHDQQEATAWATSIVALEVDAIKYWDETAAPLEAELVQQVEALGSDLGQQLYKMETKAKSEFIKMLSPFCYSPSQAEDIGRSLAVMKDFDMIRASLAQGAIASKAGALVRAWEKCAPFFL
jgi:hypothetical protein